MAHRSVYVAICIQCFQIKCFRLLHIAMFPAEIAHGGQGACQFGFIDLWILLGKAAELCQALGSLLLRCKVHISGQMLLYPSCGILPHPEAEDQEGYEHHEDKRLGKCAHGKQHRIVKSVQQYGHKQDHKTVRGVAFGVGIELDQRVIVSHHYAKAQMSRHGKYGPHDSHAQEVLRIHEQVSDVLKGGKAHGDTGGIDNAIELLVEIWILPQEIPQNRKLGYLLRYGGSEEGDAKGIHNRFRLLRVKPDKGKGTGHCKRQKARQHAPVECLAQLFLRFRFHTVLPI